MQSYCSTAIHSLAFEGGSLKTIVYDGTADKGSSTFTFTDDSDLFDTDLYDEISLQTCVEKRISEGGTSVGSVRSQIAFVKEEIAKI